MRVRYGNYYQPNSPFGGRPSSSFQERQASAAKQGSANCGLPSPEAYFNEMRQAIGKKSPNSALSVDDLQKYERILTSAEELLNDTIAFSERASSSTEVFREQKKALDQRLTLTKAIQSAVRDGVAWLLDDSQSPQPGGNFEEFKTYLRQQIAPGSP